MKKLRLNVEEIRVERFETVTPAGIRGTILGQDNAGDTVDGTCDAVQSCATSPVKWCRPLC